MADANEVVFLTAQVATASVVEGGVEVVLHDEMKQEFSFVVPRSLAPCYHAGREVLVRLSPGGYDAA
jgi:hypothetical protein